MNDKQKAFRQKVKNRKFAMDHSWRKVESMEEYVGKVPVNDDQRIWSALDESLSEANMRKFRDPFFRITSHRKKIGRIVVFLKRGLRKLLHIFLGWYLFPVYQQQNVFNGKLLNSVVLERDLIVRLEDRIHSLEVSNARLREEFWNEENNRIGEAEKRLHLEISAIQGELNQQQTEAVQHLKQYLEEGLEREAASRVDLGKVLQEKLCEEAISRADAFDTLKMSLAKLENMPTSDDEFYHHFEERFRGSREEIVNRLNIYVPVIQEHLKDWSQARFIDIGSGRGEWMDILKYHGAVDCVGVDLNARQNAIAEEHGHKTVCRDCIEYLTEQPDNSVDLISGIQLIEHLSMSDLMELLKQSHRVLKKGGMILFETPNPRNISVAAYTFYNDPSHKRPLDPGLMSFLAEWSGFNKVKCIDANSNSQWQGIPLPEKDDANYELIKQFNDIKWLLYGPMDYALFAVKE